MSSGFIQHVAPPVARRRALMGRPRTSAAGEQSSLVGPRRRREGAFRLRRRPGESAQLSEFASSLRLRCPIEFLSLPACRPLGQVRAPPSSALAQFPSGTIEPAEPGAGDGGGLALWQRDPSCFVAYPPRSHQSLRTQWGLMFLGPNSGAACWALPTARLLPAFRQFVCVCILTAIQLICESQRELRQRAIRVLFAWCPQWQCGECMSARARNPIWSECEWERSSSFVKTMSTVSTLKMAPKFLLDFGAI